MSRNKVSFVVLSLSILLALCSSKPTSEDGNGKDVVAELTKLVEKLHLQYFEGDPVVEQYVDKANDYTTYKLAGSGPTGVSLYERKHNDNEKDFVVLTAGEDKIPETKNKNIYVGLRRAGDDGNKYHPFFIYIRNRLDKDEPTVSLGGEEKVIEFDSWLNRENRYQTLERRFGWDECSSSIFVPCKTTQAVGLITPRKHLRSLRRLPAAHKPSKSNARFESNDNMNFFWDLNDGEEGTGQTLFSPELAADVATGNGDFGAQAKGRGFLGGFLGGGNGCGGGGFLSGIFGGDSPCYTAGVAVPVGYPAGVYPAGAYPPGAYPSGYAYPAGYPGYPPGYNPGGVGGVVNGALGTAGGIVNSVGNLAGGILNGRRRRHALEILSVPEKEPSPAQRSAQLAILRDVSQRLNAVLGEELLKTDLYTYPGWKTIDRAGRPNDSLSHESDAFVGFGTCVYKRMTKEDYDKAKTPDQVLLVIATALRTNCIDKEMAFYDALLKDGFLEMNSEKTFDVVADNKFVAREKLSPRRRSELTRAFETALFSKTYKTELYSKTPLTAPENPISRRVHVLSQTILDGVTLAGTKLRQHRIKLLRSLAMTVNTAFMKLLQDYEGMRDCEKCTLDLEVNHADQIQLMALLKFLVYGVESLNSGSASVEEAFKTFNSTNAELISERVAAYL